MLPDLVNPVVSGPPKGAGCILAYSHQTRSSIIALDAMEKVAGPYS